MIEIRTDRELGIKTIGIREWKDRNSVYNRCEPTPYVALDALLANYKFNPKDHLLDVGCGRGRVGIYLYHKTKIRVTGIEINETTLDEADSNLAAYEFKHSLKHTPIQWVYSSAEQYEIEPSQNVFYFFNPFSVQIFKKAINNILISHKEHERPITLIIYYPIGEYQTYLKKSTPFKLAAHIPVPELLDSTQYILIYKL